MFPKICFMLSKFCAKFPKLCSMFPELFFRLTQFSTYRAQCVMSYTHCTFSFIFESPSTIFERFSRMFLPLFMADVAVAGTCPCAYFCVFSIWWAAVCGNEHVGNRALRRGVPTERLRRRPFVWVVDRLGLSVKAVCVIWLHTLQGV